MLVKLLPSPLNIKEYDPYVHTSNSCSIAVVHNKY